MEKRKCFVIFTKPVVIPDGNLEKVTVHGFLIDVKNPEIVTYENICKYVETYVLPIVEIFEDGFEDGNGWTFIQGDREITYKDSLWDEYLEKSKSKNNKFYIADAEYTQVNDGDLYDDYWITSEKLVNEIKRILFSKSKEIC